MARKNVNITDVCSEIFAGGDAPKNQMSIRKTSKYTIPIYSNGIDAGGLYGYTNFARVTLPSITISARGTIGYTAIRNEPFVPIVRLITITPIPELIDIHYLYYAVKNFSFNRSGTSIPQLTVPMVKQYNFPLPSLDEQRKIAAVLDKISDLIAKRRQQLDKLDELVKSRFIEMFGDLMINPYEWPIMKISEISTYLKSGLSRKLSDEDIGLPVIRSGNIQNGKFIYDDIKYWYIDDPQGAKISDYILDDGDILVNFINSASQIGKTAIYEDTGRECIYTTNIFRMKLGSNCNKYYYNWFAMTEYYYKQIQNIIQPAVNQASFTTVNFLKLNIPVPPIELQKQFAAFVAQVDKSKLTIQKSLEKLEVLKKALMQEYFR